MSANGDSIYYDVHLEIYKTQSQWNSIPPISSFDTLFLGDSTMAYDISANNTINTYTLHHDSTGITWMQTEDGNQKMIIFGDNTVWNIDGCFITEFHSGGKASFHKGIGYTYQKGGRSVPTRGREFYVGLRYYLKEKSDKFIE